MHVHSWKLLFPYNRHLKATIALISCCGSWKSFTFYLLLGDINGFRFWRRKCFQNTLENTFWLTLCRFFLELFWNTICGKKGKPRQEVGETRERKTWRVQRKPLFRRLGNPNKKPRSHPQSRGRNMLAFCLVTNLCNFIRERCEWS